MKRLSAFVLMISLAFGLMGIGYAKPKDDLKAMEAKMKARLAQIIELLEDPAEKVDVTLVDTLTGYTYSEIEGLKKPVPTRNNGDGTVTLANGTTIRVSLESQSVQNGDVGILATYQPFRRVKSKDGYRKTEGYITLPASTDLDGISEYGEAAYNYFGFENSGTAKQGEVGLFTGPPVFGWEPKQWYVYHNFTGTGWQEDYWPSGGISPGTQVFMRTYVPQDGTLVLYISYGSTSKVFTYENVGTKYNGSNQKLRRVTSLLLNDAGKTLNNVWSNMYIATPTDMHLWETADTYEAYSSSSNVSVTETNKYYNETVNIQVD